MKVPDIEHVRRCWRPLSLIATLQLGLDGRVRERPFHYRGGGWKTFFRLFSSVHVNAGFFFTYHLKPDILFSQRIQGQIFF